jgi:hypothetical protein
MNINILNSLNFRSLSAVYSEDNTVIFKNKPFNLEENISFNAPEVLKDANDNSINNFSNLFLSKKQIISDVLSLKQLSPLQDEGFSTYIAGNAIPDITTFSKFWVVQQKDIGSTVAAVAVSGSLSEMDQRYFFDILFLDENKCKISHEDKGISRYLTVDITNNLIFAVDANADGLGLYSPQIFSYIYDKDTDAIVFLKNLNDVPKFLELNNTTNKLVLSDPLTAGSVPYSSLSLWKFMYRPEVSNDTKIYDSWVSYEKNFKNNSQDINENRSFENVNSNILLHNQYYTLSNNTLNLNLLSLKNTSTPENFQSRSNPFIFEPSVEFRDYKKIFSGSNQILGNDNISMSYDAFTNLIQFFPDQVTYFHIPYNFYPYKQLNINDAGLIEAGAIAGDHPLKADKVFKKKADYKDTSHYGETIEETDSTFLCSWLSGSINSDVKPIWVDRYYDPAKISFFDALSGSEFQAIRYVSVFECLFDQARAILNGVEVFDKPSDLIFEPGTYYAYQHIGPQYVKGFLRTLEPNLVQKNLANYKFINGSSAYDNSIENQTEFVFDGNRYSYTVNLSSIENTNQFTMCFFGYSDDWSKPIGYQLIGNFAGDGFGIFNYNTVTPTIFINNKENIEIFNTDMKFLQSIEFSSKVLGVLKFDGFENYYVLLENNKFIRMSNLNTHEKSVIDENGEMKYVINYDYDYNDAFFLCKVPAGPSFVNKFYRADLVNMNVEDVTADPDYIIKRRSPVGEFPSITVSNVQSFVYYNDYVYMTPGRISKKVGNDIYYLKESTNTIIKWKDFEGNSVPILTAFKINYTVDSFNFDFDQNIWILFDKNKFIKYTQDRTFILSGVITDTTYKNFNIDFVSEIDKNGAVNYPIITQQAPLSSNKLKFITLNNDGVVLNTTFSNITTAFGSNFTNSNFLRNYIQPKYSSSNLNVKTKLVNVFATSQNQNLEIITSLSSLDPGYHHFAVRYDSYKGFMSLFIDSYEIKRVEFAPRKFKFSNLLDRPFFVGTSIYTNSLPLFNYLEKPAYVLSNFKIKGFYLYSTPLNNFDIYFQNKEDLPILSVNFDIACGKRSYMEEIERFFRFSTPGSKSTNYNLIIKNTGITNSDLKNALESRVINFLEQTTPGYSKLNKIKWIN